MTIKIKNQRSSLFLKRPSLCTLWNYLDRLLQSGTVGLSCSRQHTKFSRANSSELWASPAQSWYFLGSCTAQLTWPCAPQRPQPRSLASLVVLLCHLWLNMKRSRIQTVLPLSTAQFPPPAQPPSPGCSDLLLIVLQNPSPHLTSETPIQHFLPKCSSSATVSSHLKALPTQQAAKSAMLPAQPQSKPEPELQKHPLPTKHFPFPKH